MITELLEMPIQRVFLSNDKIPVNFNQYFFRFRFVDFTHWQKKWNNFKDTYKIGEKPNK